MFFASVLCGHIRDFVCLQVYVPMHRLTEARAVPSVVFILHFISLRLDLLSQPDACGLS